MPKLSLWRPTKGADYKFMDDRIREQINIGGVGINVHRYLGAVAQGENNSATQPTYESSSITNIQDLLFLENRDRKYDKDVIFMKGHYAMSDLDFNLSQFGLFLQNDTIYVAFHLNDMIQVFGRKIMNGDVLEFPHLQDDHQLEDDSMDPILTSLKKYYVVDEGMRPAEGFSQTWYPHLWRIKAIPLVDSQEYRDIIGDITAGEGETGGDGDSTLKDIISDYQTLIDINDAIIADAEADALESGYPTNQFWIWPRNEDGSIRLTTADQEHLDAASGLDSSLYYGIPEYDMEHYLSGDGVPPNGAPATVGVSFPQNPNKGNYVLRTDYKPSRLYVFDGRNWNCVEGDVRMELSNYDTRETQKSKYFNNEEELTLSDGTKIKSRQSVTDALKARED